MENYFKPVHSPSGPGEIKPRKHHHHRHLHHDQDPQSHRYTMFDDTDRNTDDSHGHHRRHQHGRYLEDSPPPIPHRHQTQQFHHSEEDEILYNSETPVTLSRASSSSLSSSDSSSSFSSWYTEESANDPFTLRHAAQPQHSLSCSNIADVRRGFREDDSSEPIVFATIKHAKQDSVCSETHVSPHKQGKGGYSSLDRCHSRSAGLLQGNASDVGGGRSRARHENYGTLYKTASLNRSLAFSEEDIMLGISLGPKRAVSSSQLPSKGILKNKEPHNDIRKAKSMEVLSPRVSKASDPSGQKGKGITQAEIEQARANFVQGKLQFSAFLDEITKQVISPSDLTILGLNNNKTTVNKPAPGQAAGPEKPQLPPKKNRESSGEERAQQPRQQGRQEKAARSTSGKHPDGSSPDKLTSYPAKKHHGSPPPNHHLHSPSHKTHHGGNRKDRRPPPAVGSSAGDRYGRSGPHLTDGTSTSPEPSVPKQRHHRKQQQPTTSHGNHTQHFSQHQPQQAHPGPGNRRPASSPTPKGVEPGHRSESSSTKSDSSRTRDTASTATSHSSEQSARHHSPHEGHSKQHRETLWDADHLRALQEENSDLHQNLLQTVVCIESLEVELQRTRDELSHVKDKYKSLLESHSGTKQSNNLLGEHLHIASESLNSERKHLLNRVSELSSELDDAHRTMASLENINVPCLIKELLEKHFNSAEVIQKLLSACFSNNQSANSPQADIQSNTSTVEEAAHYWQKKPETAQQRVTAFIPFNQGGNEGRPSGQDESRHSPPFSVKDISTAIYKNMAASYAARPRPLYPQSQQQPQLSTNHTDAPTMHQQARVGGDGWMGNGEVKVTLVEQDVVDVTSASAQQILDEFMQQLQAHKEVGGGKEQQGGWSQ
ncbi:uncharacterized protein LOC121516506 [Cheilinus undulatus]|uniref:uncharacterized protein LOC121516506 n=1 Tax=Cheilinus undulatus TaxID=241271 RepID=UPI001BD5F377|nr:uncharacterized protein LOC121516506 [Cheilinus undulatus]